jgi:hypothetical protein
MAKYIVYQKPSSEKSEGDGEPSSDSAAGTPTIPRQRTESLNHPRITCKFHAPTFHSHRLSLNLEAVPLIVKSPKAIPAVAQMIAVMNKFAKLRNPKRPSLLSSIGVVKSPKVKTLQSSSHDVTLSVCF